MQLYFSGGQSIQQFLTEALQRSSPSNVRLLAELFGGLELGLDLAGGTQAVHKPENETFLSKKSNFSYLSYTLEDTTKYRLVFQVISVGGASTKCQYQSPCYDSYCKLCYDPLLRIHGLCGDASYFTCRGTLPKGCLPFSCTARVK